MRQNEAPETGRSSLSVPFDPPLVLRHPHAQSILPSWPTRVLRIRRRAAGLLRAARPMLLDCGGGIRLLGYHSAQPAASKGLVIMLHGWESCADASYILSSGTALYAAGFDVFRLNFRDHGGTEALNPGLFNSCLLDEVVQAVQAIQRSITVRPCFLLGFSLGGNFALRVARRSVPGRLALERVIAVCPVLQPHSTMRALETGLFVYRRYFLGKWRRSLRAKADCFPDLYDFSMLRRLPTLTATTDHCVRRHSDFPDLDSYLEGYAITGRVLEDLSVNSHIIAADDDPLIPVDDLARLSRQGALRVTRVRGGGHCGFVGDWRLNSWLDDRVRSELLAAL
jgi:predicted alpha/beta-fold hydrolase